jgi:hypothetical protein
MKYALQAEIPDWYHITSSLARQPTKKTMFYGSTGRSALAAGGGNAMAIIAISTPIFKAPSVWCKKVRFCTSSISAVFNPNRV